MGLWLNLTMLNLADTVDSPIVGLAVGGILIVLGAARYYLKDESPITRPSVLKHMSSGIITTDRHGRITAMNPAAQAILKRAENQVLHKTPQQAFPEHNALLKALKDGVQSKTDVTIDPKCYEVQVMPLTDEAGMHSGHVVMLYDVTEKKRHIKDLHAYAHSVAHDLKTPLTLLVGYSALLEVVGESQSPDEVRNYIEQIQTTSLRMGSIIDELLLLATMRNADAIATTPLNMEEIVHCVVERLQNPIKKSGAQIFQQNEWHIAQGHAPWVEEIWANYISNAVKYGGKPPVIILGSDDMGNGCIRYWVKDNGCGLNPSESEGLFTEFARLDRHATIDGHGLRLSIVQHIADALGGDVGVESCIGEGSTFYFTLPT